MQKTSDNKYKEITNFLLLNNIYRNQARLKINNKVIISYLSLKKVLITCFLLLVIIFFTSLSQHSYHNIYGKYFLSFIFFSDYVL